MMQKGYMPYKDSFDHKGPLLFLINWLGNEISYFRGVWIFEWIAVTLTFFFSYKSARIFSRIPSAFASIMISGTLLFQYFEGGNLTEEYAMPFIALGTYIFLDYLLNNRISTFRIGISGFALGAVCMLRPNMIGVWVVFCIAIFIKTVQEKDWRQLRQFFLWFIAGFALIVLPIVIWLAINGALKQCFQDYIIFNMKYCEAADEGQSVNFSDKWNTFFNFFNSSAYVIGFVGILFHLRKQPFTNITYAIYMLASLLFISISGMTYNHYGMALVPVTIYPISLIFSDLENLSDNGSKRIAWIFVTVYVLNVLMTPTWIDLIKSIPVSYEQRAEKQVSPLYNNITEVINTYSSENDSISVYGNYDFIYVHSHRKHATRYSYQFPIGQVMPQIMEEYMEQLQAELPVIIIVQQNRYDDNISQFLNQNSYSFVWGQYGELDAGGILIFYRAK